MFQLQAIGDDSDREKSSHGIDDFSGRKLAQLTGAAAGKRVGQEKKEKRPAASAKPFKYRRVEYSQRAPKTIRRMDVTRTIFAT